MAYIRRARCCGCFLPFVIEGTVQSLANVEYLLHIPKNEAHLSIIKNVRFAFVSERTLDGLQEDLV